MRYLFNIIGICLICQFAIAQTDTIKPKNPRLLIGISGGINMAYRLLSVNPKNPDPILDKIIGLRNNIEIMDRGLSYGLEFQYRLGKRWSLRSGVNFNQYNYKTKVTTYVYATPEPYLPVEGVDYTKATLLEVPVKLNYRLSKHKFDFHATAGFGINIFLNKSSYTIVKTYDGINQTYHTNYIQNPYPVSVSVIGALGIDYHINKIVLVRLEPAFKFMLSPFNNDPIITRLYSYNINLGVLFKI